MRRLLPLALLLSLSACATLPDRGCQIAKALVCPPAPETELPKLDPFD